MVVKQLNKKERRKESTTIMFTTLNTSSRQHCMNAGQRCELYGQAHSTPPANPPHFATPK